MSIEFQLISCSSCGLGASSLTLAGSFIWRDDERREYSIPRELGFCRGCDKIIAKEQLPSRHDFNKAKDVFNASLMILSISARLNLAI